MSTNLRASRAFFLALFSEAKTTEDRMPMMAMTTKSSISVKPCLPLGMTFFEILNIFLI